MNIYLTQDEIDLLLKALIQFYPHGVYETQVRGDLIDKIQHKLVLLEFKRKNQTITR